MFKNERQKQDAEKDARNALLNSKGYSSKELESMKKLVLTPCSYCQGTGEDPHAKYADCNTCKGFGVLMPRIDPRRVLATIANLNGAYSDLKQEKEYINKYIDFFNKQTEE